MRKYYSTETILTYTYHLPWRIRLWLEILLKLGFQKRAIKIMEQFHLKPAEFAALIFTGTFDTIDGDANAYAPGSGKSFKETESEAGKTLSFTDADGNEQTAQIGDALKVVKNDDGSFKGYQLVTAADQAATSWVVDGALTVDVKS